MTSLSNLIPWGHLQLRLKQAIKKSRVGDNNSNWLILDIGQSVVKYGIE